MGLDAGFLTMLTAEVSWEANTGKDTWGNEQYAGPAPLKCFIDPEVTEFGTDAGNNRQENTKVFRTSFICDAVGVGVKDRVTLPGGGVRHVTNVETAKDETGGDLYQTVTVESTQKG